MAARTWNSSGSTDLNDGANYTGSGALLSTDDLTFDGTSVVNATATAALDVQSISTQSAYTGKLDFADFTYSHTVGGDCTFAGGGEVDMGDCTLTSNGNFACESQSIVNRGTSTLVLAGTAKTLSTGAKVLIDTLSITGSYTISAAGHHYIQDVMTVSGTLTINASCTLRKQYVGGLTVTSTGTIDGAGTLEFRVDSVNGDLVVQSGGTLSANVKFINDRSPGFSGVFSGDMDMSLNASESFTVVGDTTIKGDFTRSTTNAITGSNSGNYDLTFEGDVNFINVTYTKGTGTITFSGGLDQNINFDSNSIENAVINKTVANDVVKLTGNVTSEDVTVTNGTVDTNNFTWTTSVGGQVSLSVAAGNTIKNTATTPTGGFSLAGNIDLNGSATEKIVNGDFATASGWTLSQATHNATDLDIDINASTSDWVIEGTNIVGINQGSAYLLEYEIKEYTSGSIYGYLDGAGTTRSAAGVYKEVFVVASANAAVDFRSVGSFVGTIDNVSVKEIVNWTDVDISALGTGTNKADWAYIHDSQNTSGKTIDALTGCVDGNFNLGWNFYYPDDGPTLRVDSIRISGQGSTGNQNVTISGFGTPTAALIISNGWDTDGHASDSRLSLGFWDGSANCAVCIRSNDNDPTTETARGGSNSHCYIQVNEFGGGFTEFCSITGTTTDGVVVNWASASTDDLVIVLIKGTSNASIERLDLSTSSTSNTVTPGHATDALFAIGVGADNSTDGGTTTSLISFGLGHYDGSTYTQKHTCWHAADGQGAATLGQKLFSDKIASQHTASGTTWDLSFGSVTSTQFTATCSTTSNGGDSVFFLCLDLSDPDEFEIGTSTSPTSTGVKAYTTSGQPVFAGLVQTNMPSVDVGYSNASAQGFSIGTVGLSGDENCVGFRAEDGADPTNEHHHIHADFTRQLDYTALTYDIIGTWDSFNSTDFSINYSAVDASALQNMWWAVVKPSTAGNFTGTASAQTIAVTGQSGTEVMDFTGTGSQNVVAITGQSGTESLDFIDTADAQSTSVTGQSGTIIADLFLTATSTSISSAGQSGSLVTDVILVSGNEVIAVTGQIGQLTIDNVVNFSGEGSNAAIAVTQYAGSEILGVNGISVASSISVQGQSGSETRGHLLVGTAGAAAVSGQSGLAVLDFIDEAAASSITIQGYQGGVALDFIGEALNEVILLTGHGFDTSSKEIIQFDLSVEPLISFTMSIEMSSSTAHSIERVKQFSVEL